MSEQPKFPDFSEFRAPEGDRDPFKEEIRSINEGITQKNKSSSRLLPGKDFESEFIEESSADDSLKEQRPNVIPEQPFQEGTCVIIGPSNTGKTSTLLSMWQACDLPEENENFFLKFIPSEEIALLRKRAVEILLQKEVIKATDSIGDYDFQLQFILPPRRIWQKERGYKINMSVRDGPGGALFPTEIDELDHLNTAMHAWRSNLVSKARGSEYLILCVDSQSARKTKNAQLLHQHLPELVEDLLVPCSSLFRSKGIFRNFFRLLQRFFFVGGKKEARELKSRYLPFKRILILFTKVDLICAEASEKNKYWDSPMDLADYIAPLQQAEELLGLNILNLIKSSLHPDASFAVGFSSAWGFDPETGEPFVGPDGSLRLTKLLSEAELLKSWNPYGIRDALFYIATGNERGLVKVVREKDIKKKRKPHLVAVSQD